MPVPAAAAAGATGASFGSTFGGQMLGQFASQGSSGLLGQLFGGWNARRQWKYMRKQMELQQQYQLEQMQRSYDLQREMFDYSNEYNSPVNMLARYRDAGINPAAVFGSSGASISGTMPAGSGPSGGSVSGGAPVSAGNTAPSTNAFLAASQVRLNDAQAGELETRSDLNAEKAVTEASVRNVLGATVDEKVVNTYFTQQRSLYQQLVNSRYGELTDAQISEMTAHADALVASANLDTAQVDLVRSQCAELIIRAELEHQLTTTNSALANLYRSESGFVSLQAEDLRNNIESLKSAQTLRVQRIVNENGKNVMRSGTIKVNGYQARALCVQLGAELGANEAARSFMVANWTNASEISSIARDYSSSASGLLNSISSVIKSAKSPATFSASEDRHYFDTDGQYLGGYTSSRRRSR